MTEQEKLDTLNFVKSLTREEIICSIEELKKTKSGLGEMSETARLGDDQYGPSEEDCEEEIKDIEDYLKLYNSVLETLS